MTSGARSPRPRLPAGAKRICALADIPDGGGRPFPVEIAGRRATVLLLRRGRKLFAYADRCPHMEMSLLWDGRLLTAADGEQIRCANHDAHFRVQDGCCVAGPCLGERLPALPVRLLNGVVWLLERNPG